LIEWRRQQAQKYGTPVNSKPSTGIIHLWRSSCPGFSSNPVKHSHHQPAFVKDAFGRCPELDSCIRGLVE
jgi:hypothetical protein